MEPTITRELCFDNQFVLREFHNGKVEIYIEGDLRYRRNEAGEFWYKNDRWHREDGPAVILASGEKGWWLNGERHREDGPAVECVDGDTMWFRHGRLHREDGPAVEATRNDGFKIKTYYIQSEQMSEAKFWDRLGIKIINGVKYKKVDEG